MGVLAVIINRFVLGPFARRFTSSHYVLIVTFGLSLILLNVEYSIWGAQVRVLQHADLARRCTSGRCC